MMKKLFSALILMMLCAGSVQAFTEQFKMFDNGPKTKSCRTAVVNITNEREPMYCAYVFTPYQKNKKEGTLLFEFLMNPGNPKSVEIKTQLLDLLKSLKEDQWAKVSISIEMKDGEVFTFDGSTMTDWDNTVWRELIRVSYDKDNGQYRSYIMFPLEQMESSNGTLSSPKRRHKQIVECLQTKNIVKVRVQKNSARGSIDLEIPFERPTDGTFTDMISKIKNKKK